MNIKMVVLMLKVRCCWLVAGDEVMTVMNVECGEGAEKEYSSG